MLSGRDTTTVGSLRTGPCSSLRGTPQEAPIAPPHPRVHVPGIPPCCFLFGTELLESFFLGFEIVRFISGLCALRASTLRTVEPPLGSTTGYRHAARHRHCTRPCTVYTLEQHTSSFRFFLRVPMRLIAGTPSPRNGGEIPKILRALRLTLRMVHGPYPPDRAHDRRVTPLGARSSLFGRELAASGERFIEFCRVLSVGRLGFRAVDTSFNSVLLEF